MKNAYQPYAFPYFCIECLVTYYYKRAEYCAVVGAKGDQSTVGGSVSDKRCNDRLITLADICGHLKELRTSRQGIICFAYYENCSTFSWSMKYDHSIKLRIMDLACF